MKHLGDITQIHGDQVPAVDVIIGGSPCQDLYLGTAERKRELPLGKRNRRISDSGHKKENE